MMTLHRRSREQMLAFCEEIHEDDGVDPRFTSAHRPAEGKMMRKSRQLCRQVEQTLHLVLSDGGSDGRLDDVQVLSVAPAPNSARLLVTVTAPAAADESARQAILRGLEEQSGRLRTEIAAAITRKKTPTLLFRLVPPM